MIYLLLILRICIFTSSEKDLENLDLYNDPSIEIQTNCTRTTDSTWIVQKDYYDTQCTLIQTDSLKVIESKSLPYALMIKLN